jgi:Acetyltransferase (GNAT) domain
MYNFERAMYPFIAHHFSEPPYRRNHWSLCTLGVKPQYQYRGIGRELVAWGLGRARAEELPATVIGAKGKDVFYRRCGFDLLVGWATEGVDAKGNRNPLGLRGIGGGCIMFTRVKEDDAMLEEAHVAGDPPSK